jgi:hypothetical protein
VTGKGFQLKDDQGAIINPVQNAGTFAVILIYLKTSLLKYATNNILMFVVVLSDKLTKELKIGCW